MSKPTKGNKSWKVIWSLSDTIQDLHETQWQTDNKNNWTIEDTRTDSNTEISLNISDISVANPMQGELLDKVKQIVKTEFDKENNKMFSIFWIFASVVAFLLVEVQILNRACSWQMIMWLSVIILWALSFFVLIFNYILTIKDDIEWKNILKKKFFILLLIILLFFWVWIYLSSKWDEIKCENEAIIEQYQENLYEELDYKIEKKIKKELNNIFSR